MIINPLNYKITDLNKLAPVKGRALIAEPFMDDPNFKRSVVLLAEYNENEVVGFMLNKPLEVCIQEIIPNFPNAEATVFMGGPVQTDSLFYIHTQGERIEGSQHIIGDLYWAGNFTQLEKMITNKQILPDEIIFFLGYSGWDFKQLQKEIEDNSWIISDVAKKPVDLIKEKNMWQSYLQKMGPKHALLSNFPEDPSFN